MVTRNLAAATAVALVLAACGGGSGSSSSSTQNNNNTDQSTNTNLPASDTSDGTGSPSTDTGNTLIGSNGDLSKYLGTWKSGCEVRGTYGSSTGATSSAAAGSTAPAAGDTSPAASGSVTAGPTAPAAGDPSPTASGSVTATPSALSANESTTYFYGISSVAFLSINGNTVVGQSTDQSYEDSSCTKPMSNPYDGTTNFTLTYLGNAGLAPNGNYAGSADNVTISVDGSAEALTRYFGFAPGYRTIYTSQSTLFDKNSSGLAKQ